MRGQNIAIFGASRDESESYTRAFNVNGLQLVSADWSDESQRTRLCETCKIIIFDVERLTDDPEELMRAATTAIFLIPAGANQTKATLIKQGADLILAKPLDMEELVLRVRRMLRPTDLKKPLLFDLGALSIDGMSRAIVRNDGSLGVPLTLSEVNMLRLLATNVGLVVSRQALHDAAFGDKVEKTSRALDTAMSRLRAKVKDADIGYSIISARSAGYFINRDQQIRGDVGEIQYSSDFAS